MPILSHRLLGGPISELVDIKRQLNPPDLISERRVKPNNRPRSPAGPHCKRYKHLNVTHIRGATQWGGCACAYVRTQVGLSGDECGSGPVMTFNLSVSWNKNKINVASWKRCMNGERAFSCVRLCPNLCKGNLC